MRLITLKTAFVFLVLAIRPAAIEAQRNPIPYVPPQCQGRAIIVVRRAVMLAQTPTGLT